MAGNTRKGKYDDVVSAFIDEFWKAEFRSPTIREVMQACEIPSSSTADYVMCKVAKSRGDVVVKDTSARRITPNWVILAIKNAAKATQ